MSTIRLSPGALGGAIPRDKTLRFASAAKEETRMGLGGGYHPPSPQIVLFGSGSEPQDFVSGNISSQSPRRVPHVPRYLMMDLVTRLACLCSARSSWMPFTCGPNEAPGRITTTCGPNEAPEFNGLKGPRFYTWGTRLGALGGAIPRDKILRFASAAKEKRVWVLGSITKPPSPHIVLFGSGSEPQDFVPGNSSSQSPRRVPHNSMDLRVQGSTHGGRAWGSCCVSFPKRTILSSASVGIRARDVTNLVVI
uniref:Uncharacterized protein n=1 Tax=Fagus sylvatica TaxID=28930 RepID=A0A2N9H7M6_FAGSY